MYTKLMRLTAAIAMAVALARATARLLAHSSMSHLVGARLAERDASERALVSSRLVALARRFSRLSSRARRGTAAASDVVVVIRAALAWRRFRKLEKSRHRCARKIGGDDAASLRRSPLYFCGAQARAQASECAMHETRRLHFLPLSSPLLLLARIIAFALADFECALLPLFFAFIIAFPALVSERLQALRVRNCDYSGQSRGRKLFITAAIATAAVAAAAAAAAVATMAAAVAGAARACSSCV